MRGERLRLRGGLLCVLVTIWWSVWRRESSQVAGGIIPVGFDEPERKGWPWGGGRREGVVHACLPGTHEGWAGAL